MSALLGYVLHKNNSDRLERFKAQAKAREHNLIGTDGKLKPEYNRLVNSMKSLVNGGDDTNAVIAAATGMLPDKDAPTARDLYNRLRGR